MATEVELKIKATLEKFDEVANQQNVWRVQGQPVIRHHCLERIAVRAGVQWDAPQVLRCERDEAVILAGGRIGDRYEWSVGEALIGANYRISGRQAPYVYAMAEKRAKDRVILKLVELHGLVLSEEESESLRDTHADPEPAQPSAPSAPSAPREISPEQLAEAVAKKRQEQAPPADDRADKVIAALKRRTSWQLAQEYIDLDPVQKALAELSTPDRNRVMDALLIHMESLGWTPAPRQANTEPHESAALPEDASRRNPIVSNDPHHPTNLATLPTRAATAIKDARDADECAELINKLLEQLNVDWNRVPQHIQDEVDRVEHKRVKALEEQRQQAA